MHAYTAMCMVVSEQQEGRVGQVRRGTRAATARGVDLGHRRLAAASTTHRDDPQCETVRLADIGWTDVTATTALLSNVLRDLGYRSRITLLSVPVTFASMKHGDIDAFLGTGCRLRKPTASRSSPKVQSRLSAQI